ncbi:MAG: hypothetical protein RLZZ171_88 [Cyanobacteriota bacterium]|jgi:hypothetical protein
MLKPEPFDSNQQFINAWSYFARACPQGEIIEADKKRDRLKWYRQCFFQYCLSYSTRPRRSRARSQNQNGWRLC